MRLWRLVAVTVVGLIWMNLAFAPRREPHWQPEIPGPGGSRRASGVASDPTRPVDLEGGSLSRDGRLSIPTRVRVSGDVLVVLDRYAERQVIFLHADTGEPLGSAGPRGEGPGELLGAWSVKPDPADPTRIWVLDVGNGRLTRFETGAPGVRHVAALSAGPGDGNPPTVRLETPAPLTDVLPRPDGTFLGLGFFDEGRFGVFGPDGRWRGAIGPVPDEDSGLPPAVLAHAWQGMLRARPDGRRLVVACRHAAMLQLYAPDGRLLAEADGPDPFRPRFTVVRGARGPVFASGEDLRFGYVDVAVTGDRIYALYSGRTRADAGPDAVFGREVDEFDWDGRFLGGHLLDADVISIEVDPEGRRLWAVRHDPVPEVREYRLDR